MAKIEKERETKKNLIQICQTVKEECGPQENHGEKM